MGLLKQKQLSSSAEVVEKHLILSLPNAIDPVVWRMALTKIGTASFEVKPVKGKENYKLVLKPKKGAAELIAPFETKDEALEALVHASNALQRPEGEVAVAASTEASKNSNVQIQSRTHKPNSKKWFYLLAGFLLVIGLYLYLASQIPNRVSDFGSDVVSNQTGTQKSGGGAKTGVPLSADDFLSGL